MFASFGVCTGIPYSHGWIAAMSAWHQEVPRGAHVGLEGLLHRGQLGVIPWFSASMRNLVDFCTNSCAKNYYIVWLGPKLGEWLICRHRSPRNVKDLQHWRSEDTILIRWCGSCACRLSPPRTSIFDFRALRVECALWMRHLDIADSAKNRSKEL
jgi:hypothetical protein